MPSVQSRLSKDLSRAQVRAVYELINVIWPPEGEVMIDDQVAAYPLDRGEGVEETLFLVWEGEQLVAHAAVFPRTVRTVDGEQGVLALAGVCSRPDRRGAGWGRKVVEAAFALVDEGRYPVCLFQTGVPDFYRKLGAREVENVFFDGKRADRREESPWWNPHVMIYPANAPWPDGPIDLNGPGY